MFRSRKHTQAFTLVELLVSISIFALMTTLVVAKYGNFNNNVLLTNAAYDVALAIRTAQTYGLSVRSNDSGNFNNAYGVHFTRLNVADDINPLSGLLNKQTIITFADLNSSGVYDQGEEISYSVFKGGSSITMWDAECPNNVTGCNVGGTDLDIVFRRPEPNAQMCTSVDEEVLSGSICGTIARAFIVISGPSGEYRVVTVRKNGQISVDYTGE